MPEFVQLILPRLEHEFLARLSEVSWVAIFSALRSHLQRSVLVAGAALLVVGTEASATVPEDNGPLRLLFTVPIPVTAANNTGGLFSWDISFVDQTSQTLYVADRSNKAVDIVDAKTGTFVKSIAATPPFAGISTPGVTGPNGVLSTGTLSLRYRRQQPRSVLHCSRGHQVNSVSIRGGALRADKLAFDPKDHLLLVVNDANTPPFATLISAGAGCTLKVGKKISLSATSAGQLEWDPGTQRFFLSIPDGAVVRINPLTAVVDAMYKARLWAR